VGSDIKHHQGTTGVEEEEEEEEGLLRRATKWTVEGCAWHPSCTEPAVGWEGWPRGSRVPSHGKNASVKLTRPLNARCRL